MYGPRVCLRTVRCGLEGETHLEADGPRGLPGLRQSVETVERAGGRVGAADVVVAFGHDHAVIEPGLVALRRRAARACRSALRRIDTRGLNHVLVEDGRVVLV